jgi:hypothetical protein
VVGELAGVSSAPWMITLFLAPFVSGIWQNHQQDLNRRR